MGIAAKQLQKIPHVCKCGCGETFYPFPVYRSKADGGGLHYPEYKKGHHPNTQNGLKRVRPWNKGLTKDMHPSIAKMGFQPGHKPFNDWAKTKERIQNDPEIRQRWLDSKKGIPTWNKGLTRKDYPRGVTCGPNHGNWRGGKRGIRDSSKYAAFRRSIFERDNYTCQKCEDRNYKGRGSRIKLEVHHFVALKENHNLVFDSTNAITLCNPCHKLTDNFGTKLIHKRKNQAGK
jgi:5-methylcytosine-specific restriction endonuclease McrA